MSAQPQPASRPESLEADFESNSPSVESPSPASSPASDNPVGKDQAQQALPNKPAANDESKPDHGTNLIRRTVEEITALMAEVHDIREELLAHGVQFHMLNALIELGVRDKNDELEKMVSSALESSVREHGPQAIKREELEAHLSAIVTLEKDLRHVKQVAKQQGVHMQALNHLTQLMRLNPGDGGVQAINTFLAYADASGVPLDRMDSIRAQFQDGPTSVLPDIPIEDETGKHDQLKELLGNLLVGSILTVLIIWMVM